MISKRLRALLLANMAIAVIGMVATLRSRGYTLSAVPWLLLDVLTLILNLLTFHSLTLTNLWVLWKLRQPGDTLGDCLGRLKNVEYLGGE